MYQFTFNERTFSCPVELALSTVQGKWKVLILWHLRRETLRYSEIQKKLPRITHKMLSQQLRELEADGLLHREVYPVVPPRVEYTMTEEGKTLIPMLRAMQQWGLRFKETKQEETSEH